LVKHREFRGTFNVRDAAFVIDAAGVTQA